MEETHIVPQRLNTKVTLESQSREDGWNLWPKDTLYFERKEKF